MPELPEVEHFRTLLLPLVSNEHSIHLERCSLDKKPPRKFMEDSEVAEINEGNYCLSEVIRKGKLIAMVLVQKSTTTTTTATTANPATKYLLVHMGMTGRISTPSCVPQLESLTVNDYPPPHTYLQFRSGTNEASFSDPRKFGFIQVTDSLQDAWDGLAPDAWLDASDTTTKALLVEKMAFQSMGIKAMLLDQKRILSGVGNWVADEVLYQTQIHPDQNYLTHDQAHYLLDTLHTILSTAISCLVETKTEFPQEWLFHFRWNGKKTTKDAKGRMVTFVTSGGRTSAIVPSLQQKKVGAKRSSETGSTTQPPKTKRQRIDSKRSIVPTPIKSGAISLDKDSSLPVDETPSNDEVTTKITSTKKARSKPVKDKVSTTKNDEATAKTASTKKSRAKRVKEEGVSTTHDQATAKAASPKKSRTNQVKEEVTNGTRKSTRIRKT